jgi:very-short-patch-repair endonuclease
MSKGIYTRTEKMKENMSKSHIGQIAWNKNKKGIYSDKTLKKMSVIKKGKHYSPMTEFKKGQHYSIDTEFKKGHKMTKDELDKIVKSRSWYKHSEETKRKMREKRIENPSSIFKDTKIELKIEAELIKRNINYQKQVPLCKVAVVDFYLPEYRIVIQADGDYWHNLKKHKERDKKQDAVLTFNGFNVYRFWEHEINKSVEECINKIKI